MEPFCDTVEDQSQLDLLIESDFNQGKLLQLALHCIQIGVHVDVAPTIHNYLRQLLYQQKLAILSFLFIELFENLSSRFYHGTIENIMFNGDECHE